MLRASRRAAVMRTPTVALALAAGVAPCLLFGCGTSLTGYTCRDVTATGAKREALAEVIVVQIRAKRKVVSTTDVERTIMRMCSGKASERLAPDAKPYGPVLRQVESQLGLSGPVAASQLKSTPSGPCLTAKRRGSPRAQPEAASEATMSLLSVNARQARFTARI